MAVRHVQTRLKKGGQTMGMLNIRSLAFAALLLGPLAATTGCYVEADEPVAVEGYEPQYYDGRMVYYDTVGRPYYYEGGAVVWIPASSPYYAGYYNHWRTYGPAYNRWYASTGYRYRTYRGSGGYYGGHAGYRTYRGGGYRRR